MRSLPAFGLLLVVLGLAGPLPSVHALTRGGGPAATDCLAEFAGTPANRPLQRPREMRCFDNDSTCDEDSALGVCRFRAELCLNVTDPELPSCAPKALDGASVKNEQPDTNPLHDFDFQALEDQLNFLALPIEATDLNVCSGEVFMELRLPIFPRIGGGRYRVGRKVLRPTLFGPAGVKDEDRLRMSCVPAEDSSPCDGVTSTFDQIEKHVFNGASCTRSTCHNVAQDEHNLSLSPGEAYDQLVGVPPANFTAGSAGKLRVDLGNPENSFLIDKLRGELELGEGDRMPRGLRRLPNLQIRLIGEWITAGAPATGFVSAVDCQ